MPIHRCLYLLLCLYGYLPARSQTLPEQVTVDAYLTLGFPGRVTHFDTLGVTLFQTTVDHMTYQVVKKAHVFDEASQDEKAAMMDQAAQLMMNNPKFDGLTKRMTDTLIAGANGRFVQISRSGGAKPYFVSLFIAIQGTNIYSLQFTSYNPHARSQEGANYFYTHAVFRGLQPEPVKQPK